MAAAMVAGGCSPSHRGRGSPPAHQGGPPAAVSPVTELSYALASVPPGNWNILAAGSDQQALAPVADQVWPSVFSFGPDFDPLLDTALVQSVKQTSDNPQTIVYKINPKATWSDGTPVTGADFVYNWEAQSGRPGTPDVGGKPFAPATTAGYSDIRSVTFSVASPDVVTVVFVSPDPDWTALFRHLMPAHIAQKIGFDTGFTDPVSDLVSDGPYVVASYDTSGVVHLVRNPSYAGSPAAALEFDVHFLPDTKQVISALLNGQISCAELPATSGGLSALKAAGSLAVSVGSGPSYVDLVFNAASGSMSSAGFRAAITGAISRPSVISTALGGLDPQAPPLGNRFLVAGESGFTANGPPPAPPPRSATTSTTSPMSIRLAVASTDPLAVAVSRAVAEQLDAAGLAVTVDPVADPSKLSPSSWDAAVLVRQLTPWPLGAITAYQSGDPSNIGRVSDPALDEAISAAIAAPASQQMGLVDQVDTAAWQAYADLPIVGLPEVLACQTGVTGPSVNASPDGPAYNAAGWGLRSGSS
jgi:peptide/nickel transport system substrate-binding protein